MNGKNIDKNDEEKNKFCCWHKFNWENVLVNSFGKSFKFNKALFNTLTYIFMIDSKWNSYIHIKRELKLVDTIGCIMKALHTGILNFFQTKNWKEMVMSCSENLLEKQGQNLVQCPTRVVPFIKINKRKLLMNAFFKAQFNYYPLVWMLHSHALNNNINRLQERCLHVVSAWQLDCIRYSIDFWILNCIRYLSTGNLTN